MSIAGGLPNAVIRAAAHGCEALQIFTKSSGQWRARPLPPQEIAEFRAHVEATGIQPVFAHASYLINLATASPPLRAQSIAAFGEEMDRADSLGLDGVVVHPGACTSGTERDAIALVADALRAVLRTRRRQRSMILLEHTAGQGTSVGHRFEHLAAILDRLNGSPRVGVCLDTCHLLAAGYDIVSPASYRETFRQFDRLVGLDRLKVFHLNDSKKPCRSRVDRHEHIGRGCLGLDTFARLLNDRRFAGMPMLLETPKTEGRTRGIAEVDPLDAMNLKTLRGLLR